MKKLDLPYSQIKQINIKLIYQERIDGVDLDLTYIDNNFERQYIDHEILEDKDCKIYDLVKSVCSYQGGVVSNIKFKKHLLPYFDLKEIKKHKIRFYDLNSGLYFTTEKDHTLETGVGRDT
jgi:hypothetical protein